MECDVVKWFPFRALDLAKSCRVSMQNAEVADDLEDVQDICSKGNIAGI